MRLLERKNHDDFSLTKDFVDNIPAYTILSHTWGNDDQEVTFKDINEGSGKSKAGFQKIRFCGEQAARDGFRYFWVDTCCIDKANNAELSEALNSMYRWYRDAAKCYVYLADVSKLDTSSTNESSQLGHKAFQKSRWFTRGWTLQELLAPQSVQFFSFDGKLLGDKKSLEPQIHEITGIAVSALQGTPPSKFTVKERYSWAENRQTRREEDEAYSLLGIFGVFLPLIYGEGRENAFRRLQEEIDKSANPTTTKKPIKLTVRSKRGHRVLPFPRNINFVGRESYLEQLTTKLNPQRFTTTCIWMALDGLGGVGKTQITLQFAYQVQEMSPECSVFWVQATDAVSFDNSYREIALELGISGLDKDKADVKQLVLTALEGLPSPWLLIIDNADDYKVLSNVDDGNSSRALIDYLPRRGTGAVLFTTRDNKAATNFAEANVIRVDKMLRQESVELLTNSVQVQKHDLLDDGASIKKLLDLLLDLPLAIKQAAAYINNNSTSITEYLSFYDSSEEEIIEALSEGFEDRGRYRSQKNPVATTWSISFRQLRRDDPYAADYLSFMGVIVREDIPLLLLPPGKTSNEQKKAIGTLIGYSFMTRRTGEAAFDVHRLVHLATRNWLRMEGQLSTWAEKAINRLVELIPVVDYTNRALWTRYLPHGIYLADTVEVSSDNEIAMIKLLARLGRCQYINGQYISAEKTHQRSLVLQEKVLGKEHPDTLTSKNEVGLALNYQGKYAEAEAMHRETLALREKVSGTEHPFTLMSRNNLGLALSGQGKYAEAEVIHRETLALWEKVSGKEHPDTLTSRDNLGSALSFQWKYAEVEAMQRETLALREKLLGMEHPETLMSTMWLASTLARQGKHIKAEEMYQQILKTQERVLGKEHPHTLMCRNNIGSALSGQGKYAEAEVIHRETLALREKVMGMEHPDTLTSMNELGLAMNYQGKYSEAEAMHQKILSLRKKVSGEEHPDTLTSMMWVATMLGNQGKHAESEEMYTQIIKTQEKVLGKEHPNTLTSRNNLGLALSGQGKNAEAEVIHRETLALWEKAVGTEHPLTLECKYYLTSTLKSQGKHTGEEDIHQETLALQEKELSKEHRDIM